MASESRNFRMHKPWRACAGDMTHPDISQEVIGHQTGRFDGNTTDRWAPLKNKSEDEQAR